MKNARHLFTLGPGVLYSLSEDEMVATRDALKEIGLYHMPYDRDVYIKIPAREAMGTSRLGDYEVPESHSVIYGPFGDGQALKMAIHDDANGVTLGEDPFEDTSGARDALESILVVLLATKNAEKVTTENKLARLGIGKSYRNRFAYTTTISLPHVMDDDPDHKPSGSKKAAHLRRGHIRRQRHGAGNQLEKTIWIAPIFVNADPSFVASRRQYFIGSPRTAAMPTHR